MSHQDWVLAQLHIPQYRLKPNPVMRLLIVTDSFQNNTFIQSVLEAISIEPSDYRAVTLTELRQSFRHFEGVIWFINTKIPIDIQTSLSATDYIETPDFHDLQSDPLLKKALWSTLCDYEHYFHVESF